MNKLIKSFIWAINGLHIVWREEVNFRIETGIAIVVIFLGVCLNFSINEWVIIVICIGAVLAAEMLNTAIEDLCDKVEPNTDSMIGKIKDIMGGFVLLISLCTAIIGIFIVLSHFWL